ASTSAARTQLRNVSALMSNCRAIRAIAPFAVTGSRRASSTSRTACWRTSSGYLRGAGMTPSFQGSEPPHHPGHLTREAKQLVEYRGHAHDLMAFRSREPGSPGIVSQVVRTPPQAPPQPAVALTSTSPAPVPVSDRLLLQDARKSAGGASPTCRPRCWPA